MNHRRRFIILASLLTVALLFSACSYCPVKTSSTDEDITVIMGRKAKKQKLRFVRIESANLWLGECEVSLAQFRMFSRWAVEYPYFEEQPGYSENWPAMNVQDISAIKFAQWLNKKCKRDLPIGYELRLPTIEEWESVARCGDDRLFPWGDNWPPERMADGVFPNYAGEDKPKKSSSIVNIQPKGYRIVGYFDEYPGPSCIAEAGRNSWKIVGMGGNVDEWCWDNYLRKFVLKGGSYIDCREIQCRISNYYDIKDSPNPFAPYRKDRRSYYGSGVRLIIAKKDAYPSLPKYLRSRLF